MPQQITSRELFKNYAKALDVPGLPTTYSYDKTQPSKSWFDTFLKANPTFVGLRTLKSVQDKDVIVQYGPRFVIYPFGYFHIQGEPVVEQYIISREEAVAFNMLRGDEGTSIIGIPDTFDGFPLDRPLAEGELLGRSTPFSPEEIITQQEVLSSSITLADLYHKLLRYEEILKQILAKP